MSSRSRHRRRSFVWSSVSPAIAEPTHFLKIILPGTIHAQNMRIPKEFVRRFENELSGEVTIGVPDGRAWKIALKKSENEVWLCKGWEEFVKYYSISVGFFLVFKYECKSLFNVVIFDASAAEIYYPRKDNSEKQNSASECRRKRPSGFDQCSYNTRSQRHKLEDEEEIIDIDDDNALSRGKSGNKASTGREIEHSRKHEKEKDRSGQGHCSKTEKRALRKKQRAIEAAKNFKPKKPFFTVTIRPANLNHCYIDVPGSFWKEHMGKMGSMKLEDCNGGKWEVNYGKHLSSIRIGKGWIGFARANNVKEGDACVFELIRRNNNFVFQVTIFAC